MGNCKFVGLKGSFCKVYKVFFVLFLYVVIYKVVMSVFKDFKFDIVVNITYRYKVNALALLLLAFINLLTYVRHTMKCNI